MKKHATFFLLFLMITTIAAAQGGKIKITGTFDNKNWDGKRVVLYTNVLSGFISSDKIKRGNFTIEDSINRPIRVAFTVRGDDDQAMFYNNHYRAFVVGSPVIDNDVLFLEPGTIHMDFQEVDGQLRCTIGGTPLNDRLQEYYNQRLADTLPLDDPLRRMVDIHSGKVAPKDMEEYWTTIKPATYYCVGKLKKNINNLWNLYHANEHNLLGLYAIQGLLYLDTNWARKDFADSILRTADPEVAETIKERLEHFSFTNITGNFMLDFEGNAILKIKGSDNWTEPTPASLKQLQSNRMSIIYFWGYDINNNVRDELAELRSTLDSIGARDINFIGVYSSEYELSILPKRLNSAGIDFPVFIDTDNQISTLYNSRQRHHGFLLVDPDGIILESTLNAYFNNDTKRSLKEFLK